MRVCVQSTVCICVRSGRSTTASICRPVSSAKSHDPGQDTLIVVSFSWVYSHGAHYYYTYSTLIHFRDLDQLINALMARIKLLPNDFFCFIFGCSSC